MKNFVWLTLGQIKALMKYDNLVNMDSRTVIAGIDFGRHSPVSSDVIKFLANQNHPSDQSSLILTSLLSEEGGLNTNNQIRSFLTNLKSNHDLWVREIPLSELSEWRVTEHEIARPDGKYFRVIGTEVHIQNRESHLGRSRWFSLRKRDFVLWSGEWINGILHFAIQAKLECGNFDVVELAPTVQCLTGNFRESNADLPFLQFVLNAPASHCWVDSMQSEEGGRFYREQNRNMIVVDDGELDLNLPPNFIWMTLNQIQTFIQYNNIFNIQVRSLFAALSL